MERADVVVIGAGVTGLSSAFWLSKAGVDVLVIEKGIVGWEASGRNGGSVGPRGDDPSVVPLATESCRLWPTMDDELGYPTEFVGKGRVAVALDEDRMAILTQSTERWSRLGIPIRVIDPQEMRELVPCVSPNTLGGNFSPRGGHANPQRTVQGFAWATLDHGGRIWQETVVGAINVSKGKVTAVETTRGPVFTETVVSCAGPQSALIGRMVGIEIPIVPARVEILATVPLPPIFQVAVGGNGLYGRQTQRGNLIFGGGPHEWTEVALDREPTKSNTPLIRNIARRLSVLFPSLADVPILRSWAGVVEEAPDYCPIIERFQSPEGFLMATVSGYGFGLCPATGKAVCELVTKRRSSTSIDGLGMSRFAELQTSWRESRGWTVGAYNT